MSGADRTRLKFSQVVAGNPPDVAQISTGDLDFAVRDLRAKPLDSIVPPEEWAAYLGGEHPLHRRAVKLNEFEGRIYTGVGGVDGRC